MIIGDAMDTITLKDLVMDDVCKNEADVFQVAFYKIDNINLISTIVDNLDEKNCNKFKINRFNWILDNKEDILKLPDIVIADKDKLTEEETEILDSLQIRTIGIDEITISDDMSKETMMSSINGRIYESKFLKYFAISDKMIHEIEEKYADASYSNEEIIKELINQMLELLKAKDDVTYEHVTHVSSLVDIFVDGMPEEEKFSEEKIEFLKNAALVHDIGKLLIPNQILRKKEKLNDEEFKGIKRHVDDDAYLFNNHLMKQFKKVALCHHERYDGLGYPNHLSGDKIPEFARVIAVLDTFDAMAGTRPYITPKTFDQIIEEYEKKAGEQFDPLFAKYWINAMKKNKELLLQTCNIKPDEMDLNESIENNNIEIDEGGKTI